MYSTELFSRRKENVQALHFQGDSNNTLEQVTAASAFINSDMSMALTSSPKPWRISAVCGYPQGMRTELPIRRMFAAPGSAVVNLRSAG